ncbi:GNAT family N-acetyltransferase [Candidatus Woesearchaeota archaeon]|nr:GNAT family N-acetyltransferase [Candidatus Woesearchaeota archaeon]
MLIRPATPDDFFTLYKIGKETPELRVSATEEFMGAEEFKWSLSDPKWIFLVAEEESNPEKNQENDQKIEREKSITGFIYAHTEDMEKPYPQKLACLIYLTVLPEFRKRGIAKELYTVCEKNLKTKGITHLYGWAHTEGKGEIISFMKKQGFAEGHEYKWMDKKIQ